MLMYVYIYMSISLYIPRHLDKVITETFVIIDMNVRYIFIVASSIFSKRATSSRKSLLLGEVKYFLT